VRPDAGLMWACKQASLHYKIKGLSSGKGAGAIFPAGNGKTSTHFTAAAAGKLTHTTTHTHSLAGLASL